MAKDKRYAERGKKIKEYVDKDRNTPVLSNAIAPVGDVASAGGNLLSGNFKEAGKDFGRSMLSMIPGQSLTAWNTTPDPTYIGGSQEALDARRQQQQQGIGQGAAYTQGGMEIAGAGADMIGGAYDTAGQDRTLARGYSDSGLRIGAAGLDQQRQAMGRQNAVTGQMLATAAQQGPSAAQAQLQMGLDQSQRAMMAQAAGARGGNQAAAMQMAQATGSNMANQVNQQAGVLRAQEAQQQQMNLLGAQQAAAGIYGGQQQTMGTTAQLGYGMQGQGLGLAQGSTGQQGQMGANVGSIGLGVAGAGNQMQGNYLGAQTETDKAQLTADTQQSSAKQGAKGGIMGAAKNIIGSMF